MRGPQFSLLTLAGIVACFAIGSCALVYASTAWSSTLTTAAVLFLIVATLAAVYRQGRTRAFWLGCAVGGWLYLLLTGWLFTGYRNVDTMGQANLDSELATSHLARWVYQRVLPSVRKPPQPQPFMGPGGQGFGGSGVGGNGFGAGGFPVVPMSDYPDEVTFIRVNHAIWLWIFALAGGAAGRWLYATRPTAP